MGRPHYHLKRRRRRRRSRERRKGDGSKNNYFLSPFFVSPCFLKPFSLFILQFCSSKGSLCQNDEKGLVKWKYSRDLQILTRGSFFRVLFSIMGFSLFYCFSSNRNSLSLSHSLNLLTRSKLAFHTYTYLVFRYMSV